MTRKVTIPKAVREQCWLATVGKKYESKWETNYFIQKISIFEFFSNITWFNNLTELILLKRIDFFDVSSFLRKLVEPIFGDEINHCWVSYSGKCDIVGGF